MLYYKLQQGEDDHEIFHQEPLRPAPDGGAGALCAGHHRQPEGDQRAAEPEPEISGADRHPAGAGGAGQERAGQSGRLPPDKGSRRLHRRRDPARHRGQRSAHSVPWQCDQRVSHV